LAGSRERPLAVGLWAKWLVSESPKALGEAERDDRIVFSDQDAHWRLV
jgi:hypothetical protein